MPSRHDALTLCWQAIVARQFGRSSTTHGMSHLCDTTLARQAVPRDNVLARNASAPLSIYPLLNLPEQCFRWAHCTSTRRMLGGQGFPMIRVFATLCFTGFRSLGGHASARRVSHKPCSARLIVSANLCTASQCPNSHSCARSHNWGFPKIDLEGPSNRQIRSKPSPDQNHPVSWVH